MTEWKPIPRYDGYEVTDNGDIRGPRGVMKQQVHKKRGYLYVSVERLGVPKTLFIHRAVLLAWVGPAPDGCIALHDNDVASDNRLSNLKWGTYTENSADSVRNGGKRRGEDSATAKLSASQVLNCRREWPAKSFRELGAQYGVSHTAIRRAVRGIKWRHLEPLTNDR